MSTGAEVVAAVRELSHPGITQAEIAAKAGCSQSQVSLAARLLAQAPDLADAVCAGRLGLARASRKARQRQPGSPPPSVADEAGWWPPVFLTVTEVAAKLSRHPSAVLRLVHEGELRSVRLGRSYRVPETEVRRVLAGEPRERGVLTVEECARILRCTPGTVYGLLYHGHLRGERNGERGIYQIPAAEFRRFLGNVTR